MARGKKGAHCPPKRPKTSPGKRGAPKPHQYGPPTGRGVTSRSGPPTGRGVTPKPARAAKRKRSRGGDQ